MDDEASTRLHRHQRLELFVYYNNDIGGHAVHNALELGEALGVAVS